MNSSRAAVLQHAKPIKLDIKIPAAAQTGLWKCRVSYGLELEKIDFSRYAPPHSKTYKLVAAEVAYPHKYEDRRALNDLYKRRGTADDIIIVVDNQLTDTSYGNLLFFNGKQWLTPRLPLLPGTMRASLLAAGNIELADIALADLHRYSHFMMINALNPFAEDRALPIKNIID